MTMNESINPPDILDQESLELLSSAPVPADVTDHRMMRMRDRVMTRIDEEVALSSSFVTIRADEGEWIKIEPLLEKKILNVNLDMGVETYLLRLHPGATLERHQHDDDEICIVLEGDVSFDDICLQTGDYHWARKSSWHGRASTVHGALIFLQTAVEPVPALI